MAKKYIELDTSSGRLRQRTATDVSSGAGNAGDIPALDSTGTLDPSLFPSSIGGDGTVLAMVCTENLADGDWVNVYNNAGTRSCRKALATDATKPAHGYVLQAYTSGATASVYFGGMNTHVALGSFVAADMGLTAFLSAGTSGATTKTCPSSSGNLVQPLGSIVEVASTVTVRADFGPQIVI